MQMKEPTEAELDRAQEAWRSLQGLTSQRAIWELSLLLTQREGRAFEHGVIEGRRYPDGQVLNPYNGELTRPRGAPQPEPTSRDPRPYVPYGGPVRRV